MRYLSILPLLLLMIFFSFYSGARTREKNFLEIIEEQSVYRGWGMMTIGTVGMLKYLGFNLVSIIGSTIILNAFLRICSYFWHYKDGINLFQFFYYIGWIVLLGLIGRDHGSIFFEVFLLAIYSTMALYSFIIFALGSFVKVGKKEQYLLLLFFTLALIGWIININKTMPAVAFFLAQLYYTFFIALIVYLGKYHYYSQHSEIKIDVKDLLQGLKISEIQKPTIIPFFLDLYEFFYQADNRIKKAISIINVIIVGAMMIYFFSSVTQFQDSFLQFFFRGGLALFGINYSMIKKIDFEYEIQRPFVFAIMNLCIYVSIYSIFGNEILYFVTIGVMRNILLMIGLLNSEKLIQREYLRVQDLVFWFWSTVGGFIVNCFFLIQLNLATQLLFSMIFLYGGATSLLLMYCLKHIRTMKADYETTNTDFIDTILDFDS
ncbi:MAG TPA: hypothetical protein PKC14_03950 [Candidatus Absconditabacterales bacterium]|nr:hypothetical protein [Candidatus Absconditabacterales bacterium]